MFFFLLFMKASIYCNTIKNLLIYFIKKIRYVLKIVYMNMNSLAEFSYVEDYNNIRNKNEIYPKFIVS